MKIEIELHDNTDIPEKKVYSNGAPSIYSINVFAVDGDGDALSICYNFKSEVWEEVTGDDMDEWLDFKWFYVPKALK